MPTREEGLCQRCLHTAHPAGDEGITSKVALHSSKKNWHTTTAVLVKISLTVTAVFMKYGINAK